VEVHLRGVDLDKSDVDPVLQGDGVAVDDASDPVDRSRGKRRGRESERNEEKGAGAGHGTTSVRLCFPL